VKNHRDVGLMVEDTSQPGWTVLHADCNNPRIDGKQAEMQSLWDLFKVPDVVRPLSASCHPVDCVILPQLTSTAWAVVPAAWLSLANKQRCSP